MASKKLFVIEKPMSGSLLISNPFLNDPNFFRSVILICEYNEEGTFGLVLNRQIPISLSEVLDNEPIPVSDVYIGGPVQPDTLHVIHQLGSKISQTKEIISGIYWGGYFDQIKQVLISQEHNEENFRFFIGYSGWAPGQLEKELLNEDWILSTVTPDLIFSTPPDDLWRECLNRLGEPYNFLQHAPDEPELN